MITLLAALLALGLFVYRQHPLRLIYVSPGAEQTVRDAAQRGTSGRRPGQVLTPAAPP